ncbi:GNAT family N-acetyltransferase [Botryobacter ruber]|uniref:GNAT family N-acetyltransferase n=1 Tax=Botryobacter ruber TaxID=2171629 RepID=UPI0013E3FE21|nr:GNAT family N-acetyltransferase [Botryobacter ruber]
MIRYLRHEQINKTRWDACVDASAEKHFYGLSWYLDVVSPGWEGVVEETQGQYLAVMPVPVVRKLTLRLVRQPFFCQQLGIYAAAGGLDAAKLQALTAVVKQRFRLILDYSFNTENAALLQPLTDVLQLREYYTHYLPLQQPYKAIAQNYTRDRKMNLKRAQRANLHIVESDNIEPLISFFQENIEQKIYGGVSDTTYELLRELTQVLQQKGLAKLLYAATADGTLTAGALFVTYGKYIVYLFNAADATGRKANGRTLLLDEIIRRHAGSNLILDFESPSRSSIVHFYASFGAVPAPYHVLHQDKLLLPVRWLRQLRMAAYRKLLRQAPQPD